MIEPAYLALIAIYLAYRVGRWAERTETEEKYPQVAHDRAQARCDKWNRESEERRKKRFTPP
jgi:hypothetical protein